MGQHLIRRTAWNASRWIELLAWACGLLVMTSFAFSRITGITGRAIDLQQFATMQSGAAFTVGLPDQHLWSPERIRAWHDAQKQPKATPLGVLRIRRIGLEVPILDGTDEWTLNRAVGHIEGTAVPGSEGNAGIAGHRDGFFRGLKDIRSGDDLELETLGEIASYRVERTWIVEPRDISVLDPTTSSSITLVTCYPFYFVGSAPQRFIVRAVRMSEMSTMHATKASH